MTSLSNRGARPPRPLPSQSPPWATTCALPATSGTAEPPQARPFGRQERDHRLFKTANTLMAGSLSMIRAAAGWRATLPRTVARRDPRDCRRAAGRSAGRVPRGLEQPQACVPAVRRGSRHGPSPSQLPGPQRTHSSTRFFKSTGSLHTLGEKTWRVYMRCRGLWGLSTW